MISPTASAISCSAPDPPRCDVTPHDSSTRYPDDFTQVADSANSERQTRHRPPDPIGFGFRCCVDAACTPDIRHAASTGRASRTIASGTRGGGRSDGAGLHWSGCHPLAGCSGVVGHQLPPTAAAIRDRESTRHAYALPNCARSASWSQAFPSLWWVRADGKRGQNPRAFNQVGTRPPGRWGNAHRSRAPAPQSKPVTPASRLVAQDAPLVASGLGLRILAAGPAPLTTVLLLRSFM